MIFVKFYVFPCWAVEELEAVHGSSVGMSLKKILFDFVSFRRYGFSEFLDICADVAEMIYNADISYS